MNITLRRTSFTVAGIFGNLFDDANNIVAVTLEHSFDLLPKVPDGVYSCRRGMHRLERMTHDFETFEITEVVGHTNILFHQGNFNADSNGCVLIGTEIASNAILDSRKAFEKFMALQSGVDTFQLVVK